MKKTEKSLFVQNLSEEMKVASSVVLIDYSGMGVKKQQELKKRLSEVDAKMVVVKNTLFKLAATDSKAPGEVVEDSVLSGPTALIMTEGDPISPLQVLAKFAKEFDVLQLKVGVIEGSYQDKDNLLKLSTLPGKDVLYAQAIGAIGAPLYGLIYTLQSNMQKLVYILDTASKKE
jgi:large subunit ribosomal protein L10